MRLPPDSDGDEALQRCIGSMLIEQHYGSVCNTILQLKGRGVTRIPGGIGQLRLTQLDLSFNKITILPKELFGLQLRSMNLSLNQISSIPPDISKMTALRDLNLFNNKLTCLPSGISCLTSLRRLHLSVNMLTAIPEELIHLRSLQDLRMSDNRLTQIPRWISSMRLLRTICFNGNKITKIPLLTIGSMPQLSAFAIWNNPLSQEVASLSLEGLLTEANKHKIVLYMILYWKKNPTVGRLPLFLLQSLIELAFDKPLPAPLRV